MRLREFMEKLVIYPYPESIFPPVPQGTFRKLREILPKYCGITIDQLSGDYGRVYVHRLADKAKEALEQK